MPKLNRDRIRTWLEDHNWTVGRLTAECNLMSDDTFSEGTVRNVVNGIDPLRRGRSWSTGSTIKRDAHANETTRKKLEEHSMTRGLLIDAAERFVLGARNGVVTPTTEPVSDTDTTPFGLTLRTTPAARQAVRVRSVDGTIRMSTDKVTTYETDGSEDSSDTQTDYTTD